MFTPDPKGLIAEYLFDGVIDGNRVKNTSPAPNAAPAGIIKAEGDPLTLSHDVPFGFPGKSLNFDTLRKSAKKHQYVEVRPFPDLEQLTAEVWVKPDYLAECSYPNALKPDGTPNKEAIGRGACPQPLCKSCSWYLFLSTLQTDRNLIFTHIPTQVSQGLPKPHGKEAKACGLPVQNPPDDCSFKANSGSGGAISRHPVPGKVWSHLAVTFRKISAQFFEMQIYINGIPDMETTIRDACGNTYLYPVRTNNPIAAPGADQPLRIGTFRKEMSDLDYQYSGKLCGVRIYDRALTRAQIGADILSDTTPREKPPDVDPPLPPRRLPL